MITNSGSIVPFEQLVHRKYRPDIDGLRAIAVLSVVGFHAFPFWINGGFIGVDIFFVISGFLISTIILDDLKQNKFSFIDFYSRRIKRIFPAVILVLIASFFVGWFALLADEYKQLGKHIAGGSGFISNFLFWREAGYFDNDAERKPLLHLWSLGIEEQFYILWPLVLWGICKKGFNFLTATIVIIAISFTLNIVTINKDAAAAFYSPQTRFWELLVGSILAYMAQNRIDIFPSLKNKLDIFLGNIIYAKAPQNNGNTFLNVQSALGATLILTGLLVVTKDRNFPGLWALLPILGAALIIASGEHSWFNRVVLSNRVLVWFGLISFPLYLWHWPLLSFTRIMTGQAPSREIRILVLIISIALAWITYELLEKPIRFGKFSKVKVFILILLMLFIGCVGYNTYQREGLKFRNTQVILDGWKFRAIRASNISFEEEMKKRTEWNKLGYDVCDQINSTDCTKRVPEKKKILIVGDSMAPDALRIVAKYYPGNQYVVSSLGYCAPTNQILVIKTGVLDACNKLNETRFNPASLAGVDEVIVITINYVNTFLGIEGAPSLDPYLSFLRNQKIGKIIVFGSYLKVNSKLYDDYTRHRGSKDLVLKNIEVFDLNNDEELLVVSRKNNSEFISIRDHVCNKEDGCPIFFNGLPFTWDSHHWNVEFTDYLSSKMNAQLSLALVK